MESFFVAWLLGKPQTPIVIFARTEQKAWEIAAQYWKKEIISSLYPKSEKNEDGEESLYFPTVLNLSDCISVRRYEEEDGYEVAIFSGTM